MVAIIPYMVFDNTVYIDFNDMYSTSKLVWSSGLFLRSRVLPFFLEIIIAEEAMIRKIEVNLIPKLD